MAPPAFLYQNESNNSAILGRCPETNARMVGVRINSSILSRAQALYFDIIQMYSTL